MRAGGRAESDGELLIKQRQDLWMYAGGSMYERWTLGKIYREIEIDRKINGMIYR